LLPPCTNFIYEKPHAPIVKILKKDEKTGTIRLRVETDDDLWHLYNIVREGDVVHALTERREETASDKIRSERGEKKKMILGIQVEKVEFHEFSDRLRILGVIVEGPQDLGSHHTLNIEKGDDLLVVRYNEKNRSFTFDEFPFSLAHKLASFSVSDSPTGEAAKAVYQAIAGIKIGEVTRIGPGLTTHALDLIK